MKKHLCWIPLFAALFGMIAGCPGNPTATLKDKIKTAGKSDATKVALEMVRQAQTLDRYRDGLRLLNGGFAQASGFREKTVLPPDSRKFLESTVGLSADDLAEVESSSFRPADAFWLAEAFLFRDAARSLEIAGLSATQQADLGFRWAMRHVLLHEQGDEAPPPGFVLRRGYGSARDRALVFLTLMRQLDIDGAALVLPGSQDVALVGVLDPKGTSVRLFDPRLGMAVHTKEGRIATLADVQADSKLLEASDLTAEQLKAGQWRLVVPLYSLPLRMRELERALTAQQERIVLYTDAAKLKADLERATGTAVSVWNAADGDATTSPIRALRLFLPADEGGVDKQGRLKRVEAERLPIGSVVLALRQIKLGREHLVGPAWEHLIGAVIAGMVEKYELQPAEMGLRGREEEVTERLRRIQVFLEAQALGNLADDAEAQEAIAEWRSAAAAAYEKQASKAPDAQAQVNALWASDEYLMALLQVDSEERPERYKRKILTRIVAHAIRDHIDMQARWLRAQIWLDKAEREQAIADRAGGDKAAATAKSAWLNARVNWRLYADKGGLPPAARSQRVDAIIAVLKSPSERAAMDAARLTAALHLELHQHYAAELNQARAWYMEGAKQEALKTLHRVEEDLAFLLARNPPSDEPGLKPEVDRVLAALKGPDRQITGPSLGLMNRDWAAQGTYYWLKRSVRRQIEMYQH
jgi:hypothetical protein